MKRIKRIYARLADEESKNIFENRLMFSLTEKYEPYISSIVRETKLSKKIFPVLSHMMREGLILEGYGQYGKYLLNDYPEILWLCIADNVNKGSLISVGGKSYKLMNRQEATNQYPNAYHVISSLYYYKEIEKELLDSGVLKDKIFNIGEMAHYTEENMYFDVPFLKPRKKNLFLDCGGYHGENTFNYLQWVKKQEGKAIIFEPDYSNYQIIKQRFKQNSFIDIENVAVLDKKGSVTWKMTGTSSSALSDMGTEVVRTITIDSIAYDKDVTLIKMDIEGTEKEALIGAAETIRRCKPDMAISIYHKLEDVYEILEYVLSLVPEYHIFIRHYMLGKAETVAFFVII